MTNNTFGQLWVVGLINLLIIAGLASVFLTINYVKNKRLINELLADIEITHNTIEVQKNKTSTLQSSLIKASKENEELLEVITELKSKPAEIKYIIKTETVLVPAKDKETFPIPPDEYIFSLQDNLPVARFASEAGDYTFETYALKFKSDIVIAENNTAMLLQVQSSAQTDMWHDVPVELNVTKIQQPSEVRKKFEPHIGLAAAGSAPSLDVSVDVFTTVWHPGKAVDIGGAYVGLNRSRAHVGALPIALNIGEPLPVLTDLWIAPGVSIDNNMNTNVDLLIGTKF